MFREFVRTFRKPWISPGIGLIAFLLTFIILNNQRTNGDQFLRGIGALMKAAILGSVVAALLPTSILSRAGALALYVLEMIAFCAILIVILNQL